MNPLELSGPGFLALYVLAFVALFGLRLVARTPRDNSAAIPAKGPLSTYEIAYLTGGAPAVVDAAVATLARQGRFQVRGLVRPASGDRAQTGNQPTASVLDASLEHEILAKVSAAGASIESLRRNPPDAIRRIVERLVEQDLLILPEARGREFWLGVAPFFGLVIIGAIKIGLGLSRHRAVAYLVILVLATAYYAFIIAKDPKPRLTRQGIVRLRQLRTEHAALRDTAVSAPEQILPHEAGLAYALFGSAVLVGPLLGLGEVVDSLGSPVDEQLAAARKGVNSNGASAGCGATSDCGGDSGGSSCGGDSGGSSCGGDSGGSSGGGGGGCGGAAAVAVGIERTATLGHWAWLAARNGLAHRSAG